MTKFNKMNTNIDAKNNYENNLKMQLACTWLQHHQPNQIQIRSF